jgi:transcription antitermination factor NusG
MHTLNWYAAYTQPRHEKKILAHFHSREITAFLPVYRVPRRWNNGLKVNLELPLFPGYIFVRTSLQARRPVLSAPGVVGLVGCGRRPMPIPDEDIATLANGISRLDPEPHPYIQIGDRVRLRSGPLAGREGILVRKQQNFRFVLSMDLLMQSVSVQVDAADLEHLPAARN